MVGENFCLWGNSGLDCQQINMFYLVSLCDETQIPLEGTFKALDEMGNIRFNLDMCWIPLAELPNIKLYPFEAKQGSYASLVADTNGKYYELWNAQAQYYTETA